MTTRSPKKSLRVLARLLRGAMIALLAAGFLAPGPIPRAIALEAPSPAPEIVDLEYITQMLEERIREVRDVSATVSFYQISPRDGSKTEGQLHLAAIFPDLIRATWIQPEFYAGVFYILDSERNLFTQYTPATGEAQVFPLDEVLSENTPIRITPEQLFTLPSEELFDLKVVETSPASGSSFAVVEAVHKESGARYRATVDLVRWLVTQIESIRADGQVEFSARASGIVVNQGLSAALLRRLPEGTVERSFP